MKRTRLYLLIGLITLILLVGSAACIWLAWTTDGTRWLLQTVGQQTGLKIETGRVDGRLADHLEIEALRLDWGSGSCAIGRLQLDWQPWGLLGGRLVIHDLIVERVALSIAEDETATPQETAATDTPQAAFDLTVCPEWLTVILENLEVTDFVYRSPGVDRSEVVIANRIAGHYRLTHRQLLAEDFAYHSPYVHVDGDLDWALEKPHLVMDGSVYLPPTCVDPELFETIRVPVHIPAHLELDGTWEGYRGPGRFGQKSETGETVWLNASLDGSWRGIRLDDLQGGYLHGTVDGQLAMTWINAYHLQGTLHGQKLRFGDLVTELQDATTLDVTGELAVPYDDRPFTSQLATTVKSAQIRGITVQGHAAADWLGTHLTQIDADLHSDSAHLLAQGVPDQKVTVELTADDLGMFHPDLAGKVLADGWLRWTDDSLTGTVTGRGMNLRWQDVTAQRLDFSFDHPVADAALAVRLDGRHLQYRDWPLATLEAQINGTPARHQVTLLAKDQQFTVQSRLDGHYRDDHWKGLMLSFEGRDTPVGDWWLTNPAALSLDPGRLHVDSLQLDGDDDARIRMASLDWQTEKGLSLDLAWSEVSLEWLAPLIDVPEFNGHTKGHFNIDTDASGPVSITGHLTANGHLKDDNYELDYRDLTIDLNWEANGLQFSASGGSESGETFNARMSSSDPPRWGWPTSLDLDASWDKLSLARFNRFTRDLILDGQSQGFLHAETTDLRPLKISGRITAESSLRTGERDLGTRSLSIDLNWEKQNFQCAAHLKNPAGGSAELRLTAAEDPDFAWPASGQIDADLQNLQLALFRPWLPAQLKLSGAYDGTITGSWQNRREIDMTGHLNLKDSDLRWVSRQGRLLIPLRNGRLDWEWRDQHLTGSTSVNLGDKGEVNAHWQLPLPARLPIAFDPQQPIAAALTAQVKALGILSFFSQWALQDTQGELNADLTLGGTWANPVLGGTLNVDKGSGYLAATGVRIEDLQLRTELAGDRIVLHDLSLRSGKGKLSGHGELLLDHWQPRSYHFALNGENLQIYDFPEIQVSITPDLEISGQPGLLKMTGQVQVPHLMIRTTGSSAIAASKDVVISSPGEEPEKRLLSFDTDIHITVKLGKDARIRLGGVQSKLEGEAIVTLGADGTPLLTGEIRMDEGSFRAYGTDLSIQQGILRYNRDPVTNPQLSILAVRETGNVKAGVQVGGNGEAPVITLYSQPVMPERDIISYILTGQATSKEGRDQDQLMVGAGALIPSESIAKLGLTGELLQGISVGTSGVRLRYRITKKLEVESTLGVESGVDLYYIFTFD